MDWYMRRRVPETLETGILVFDAAGTLLGATENAPGSLAAGLPERSRWEKTGRIMEYKKERTMTDYTLLRDQLLALAEDVEYEITNLSNASALLYHSLEGLNWAGFYLWRDGSLIQGPFQGKPACTRILPGRGVCGTAAEKDQTVRVEDVHQFPGHIACDCASNSEIVIPLHRNGELYGVLDMDSPRLGRFTKEDQRGLELFCRAMEEILKRNRA